MTTITKRYFVTSENSNRFPPEFINSKNRKYIVVHKALVKRCESSLDRCLFSYAFEKCSLMPIRAPPVRILKNKNSKFETGGQQKNYRILDYNVIPTKLFMAYCQIEIEDFIKSADIELQLNQKAQK